MFEIHDKVVIVTGATGNLGAAVAQKFLERSAQLVLTEHSSGRLGQLFPQIADSLDHLLVESVDVTKPDSVNEMITRVMDQFNRIDVLVNTVGGFRGGTPLPETQLETFDLMLNLNARSVFVISQAVLPFMIESKYGKIVNISARAGLRGSASMSAYSASKSAVIRLTESLSAEVSKLGINVNCILPGTIDTPQNREAMPQADYSKWVKPESIADVITFLTSESARDIHGAAIPVYGNS